MVEILSLMAGLTFAIYFLLTQPTPLGGISQGGG